VFSLLCYGEIKMCIDLHRNSGQLLQAEALDTHGNITESRSITRRPSRTSDCALW